MFKATTCLSPITYFISFLYVCYDLLQDLSLVEHIVDNLGFDMLIGMEVIRNALRENV